MSVDGGTTISMFFHPFTDWQVGHFLSACSPSRNESQHVYAVATLGSILETENLASFSLQDGATKWYYFL